MHKRIFAVLALVLLLTSVPLHAQGGPPSTAEQFTYASSTTVTTSASTVTFTSNPSLHVKGFMVFAPSSNADVVYVADNINTTATTSSMPVIPGASIMVTYSQLSVSVIAASGTQAIRFVVYYK